jgi:hypothetical protein
MNERVHTAQTVPAVTHGKRFRVRAIVALALVAGFVAWLILNRKDNEPIAPTRAPGIAASYSELQALPHQVGHDVYWAGQRVGYAFELTQTSQGNVFVRYLPAGVDVGDPRPNFLTVGTYPRKGAYASLKKTSTKAGAVSRQLDGGALAVYSQQTPTSIYVAYPGENLQVEVYDPSPARARSLVFSGKVRALP